MNKNKLIAAAVLIVCIIVAANEIWSHTRLRRLENNVETAIERAAEQHRRADRLEQQTYEYIQKIEYLNDRLEAVRARAAEQDAGLDEIGSETDAARRRYEHYRRSANAPDGDR